MALHVINKMLFTFILWSVSNLSKIGIVWFVWCHDDEMQALVSVRAWVYYISSSADWNFCSICWYTAGLFVFWVWGIILSCTNQENSGGFDTCPLCKKTCLECLVYSVSVFLQFIYRYVSFNLLCVWAILMSVKKMGSKHFCSILATPNEESFFFIGSCSHLFFKTVLIPINRFVFLSQPTCNGI